MSPESSNEQLGISTSVYRVGGSLPVDAPTYVERKADQELYKRLKAGDCCYVFNARQMGKSSLRVRVIQKLEQDGVVCATLDPQTIGTQLDQSQWYASIISSLAESFKLEDRFDLEEWWEARQSIAPVKCLSDFICNVLLTEIKKPIVIFVEEIDNLLNLKFVADDFFMLIRSFYENRAQEPQFDRLSFAFVGVATPRDLMLSQNHSVFNIGVAIEMGGFQLEEAKPLEIGLKGKVPDPHLVMREVLHWTGGQPFLTQKLLSLVISEIEENNVDASKQDISVWIGQIVQEHIIDNWETQDVPQHLKTLQDRLLVRTDEDGRGRLLGLYQRVLDGDKYQTSLVNVEEGKKESSSFMEGIASDDSEDQKKLRLTGLVVKRDNRLIVYNPIYAGVFNQKWVSRNLADLRPPLYLEAFRKWQVSDEQQKYSFLLRGKALEDAEIWAKDKRLSDEDYRFLSASQEMNNQVVLAEVKFNAEKQRTRFAIGGGIVALILAGLASWQTVIAKQNANLAADALVGQAQILFDSSNQLEALTASIKTLNVLEKMGQADPMKIEKLQNIIFNIQEFNRFQKHKFMVLGLSFHPNGKIIATSGSDKTIKIWNMEGELIKEILDHNDWVYNVRFSPNGKLMSSVSSDGSIRIWSFINDQVSDKCIFNHCVFTVNPKLLYDVKFSSDNKKLASSGKDGIIRVWDLESGTHIKLKPPLHNSQYRIFSVDFHPNKPNVLASSGFKDGEVNIWDISSEKPAIILGKKEDRHKDYLTVVKFSPNGEILASSSMDGKIKIWDIATKELVGTINVDGQESSINDLEFSSNGNTIVSVSKSQLIKIWDIKMAIDLWNKKSVLEIPLQTIKGHTRNINKAKFNPKNDNILASVSDDSTIRLWKIHPQIEGNQKEEIGSIENLLGYSCSFISENQIRLNKISLDCKKHIYRETNQINS